MFSRDGLLEFYNWTGYSLDRLFAHCAAFTTEELNREFEGFGFPTLWSQLAHVVLCEHFWVGKLSGLPPLVEDYPEQRTFGWLAEVRPLVQQRTRAYIGELSDEVLNGPITISFEDCDALETATPAYYLHHVLTHSFHHKGQAVAISRLLGRPVTQDMDLLFTPNWAENA